MRLPAFHDFDREKLVGMYGEKNLVTIEIAFDSYMHLLASSPFDQHKPIRLYKKFALLLASQLRETIRLYSSLADRILESIVYTSEDTITGDFLIEMKDTPIFREYLLFYRTGDASVLKFILTFLMFLKKVSLDFSDLEDIAFRDWLKIEAEMDDFSFDPRELIVLKEIISFLVDKDTFDDSILLPKHGSGQVSEKVADIGEKFDFLTLDAKLARCFRSDRFATSHYQRSDELPLSDHPKSSRLMFVPKTYKTYRSVCMEPTSYMYFQQEVMRWLVHSMRKSKISRIVDLSDQSLNQQYALSGSIHFSLDTIDLSAASDRVHIDLVRRVFAPKILYYLLGTRSSHVTLPNGKVIRLKKFAPMGSALCFPVQCIIFSAITMLAYLMRHRSCTLHSLVEEREQIPHYMKEMFGRLSWNFQEYGLRLRAPRVYGDDIICDSRVTEGVTHLLEHFGLVVNENKSFIGGQGVRESCGIYALAGIDITPMLLRIKTNSRGSSDPGLFASLVACVNLAGDYGYRSLQSSLIRYMKKTYCPSSRDADLPFSEDRNVFGIWTRQKRQPRLTRTNAGWQITEEYTLRIEVGKYSRYKRDTYSFDQWMRQKIHGESSDVYKASPPGVFPRHMRLVKGWTPLRM